MTVCIAAVCLWDYAKRGDPPDWGRAAVVVSDRMITVDEVQYEPLQLKASFINSRTMVLIAGDYSTHSQALKNLQAQLKGNPSSPANIAQIYCTALQGVKRQEAEAYYLAPLGLNTDTFLAQQQDYSDAFVRARVAELQGHKGQETEALIIGSNEKNQVELYAVDKWSVANCYDDVGFAAIGIGAIHAAPRMMQSRYTNTFGYPQALALTFAAKKAAEIAPGVGTETDIHLVFRDHIEKLETDTFDKLKELYGAYENSRQQLATDSINKLFDFMIAKGNKESAENAAKRQDGGHAQANAGAGTDATEAPSGNEAGQASDSETGSYRGD